MTVRPRHAAPALAVAAALAAFAFAGTSQANVQIPGLNARIAFTSDRDFPNQPPEKGGLAQCFAGSGCSFDPARFAAPRHQCFSFAKG